MQFIDKILSAQPESKVSLAKKLVVRELEQEGTNANNYVAFVDQGEESYDVNIQYQKNKIILNSCDCSSRDVYCVHQLAVLLALTTTVKSKPKTEKKVKIARAKKLSPSMELLLQLDRSVIENWLASVFKANKEVEMQFLLDFSKSKEVFEAKDIENFIYDGLTSVVGKKKKVDGNEAKRIVTIWDKSLAPVWEYLSLNIGDESTYHLHVVLLNTLSSAIYRLQFSGNRFEKYLENNNIKIAEIAAQIKSDQVWASFVEVFWQKMSGGDFVWDAVILQFIRLYNLASEERKYIIAGKVSAFLLQIDKGKENFYRYEELYLDILTDNNMFDQVYHMFSLHSWNDRYNLKFLRAIKDIDVKFAIKQGELIIRQHYSMENHFEYMQILEELHAKNKSNEKHFENIIEKFNINPTLEEYVQIMDNLLFDEEKFKFRNSILKRCKKNAGNSQFATLYFEILEQEGNYLEMFEIIDNVISPMVILNYWNVLYDYDSSLLLHIIFKKIEYNFFTNMQEMDLLIEKILTKYDKEELLRPELKDIPSHSIAELVYKKLNGISMD